MASDNALEMINNIVSILFVILGALYEIIAYIRRRPDDGPSSILQFIAMSLIYAYGRLTGRRDSYSNDYRYQRIYENKLLRTTSTITIDTQSIRSKIDGA
jgi:hypothetical protein